MNKKINAGKGKKWFTAGVILVAYSAAILLFCIYFSAFSRWYCVNVSDFLRYAVSQIFGIFPFCVAEILLAFVVVLFICGIARVVVRKITLKNFLIKAFVAAAVLMFLFVNVFGVCYTRKPIEKYMGFDNEPVEHHELLHACLLIKRELENYENIEFNDDGSSKNPHTWQELNENIDIGFENLMREYYFVSKAYAPAKRLLCSELMTYTHISGIFIPFTAEACVNTNYPEYVVAFSTAHEKAHQRGVASEDEANFTAFLACLYSGDDYLEYCALLSMYEYFLDEIYSFDKTYYNKLLRSTDKQILGEMYAYSLFFDKYRDSAASRVAEKVNDTYIKSMGDSDGTQSYGRVVELCTKLIINNR